MMIKTRKNLVKYSKTHVVVARGRFELPSADPESAMIDRYTTGLNSLFFYGKVSLLPNKSLIPLSGIKNEEKWCARADT
jgi:hypothetical protein